MKKKILHIIVTTAIVGTIITGCQQSMTKNFGGDMTPGIGAKLERCFFMVSYQADEG